MCVAGLPFLSTDSAPKSPRHSSKRVPLTSFIQTFVCFQIMIMLQTLATAVPFAKYSQTASPNSGTRPLPLYLTCNMYPLSLSLLQTTLSWPLCYVVSEHDATVVFSHETNHSVFGPKALYESLGANRVISSPHCKLGNFPCREGSWVLNGYYYPD